MMEIPDKWIVVKITDNNGDILYKVFATWYGGYLGSDSWKVNSGIVKVEEDENYFSFYGYSGSCYQCIKGCYGTNMYTQSVLNNIIKKLKGIPVVIEILPEDTNWLELIKNNEE